MSRLAKVAIVGRPNVGKSALFNCICKKRKAIVDEKEGITRDRIYEKADAFGFPFEIIDTGGIDERSHDVFAEEIKKQAEIAIEEADSLILVVDATVGPQDLDREIATILHRTEKPLCLAVNKVDNPRLAENVYDFACLGISTVVTVSAAHGFHIAELIEAALAPLPKEISSFEESPFPKLSIIGRPNVGKSMLLNAVVGENRSIVSDIAGTTRDSIDTTITIQGKEYLLIDTAGLRRKHKEKESVEKFASIRTLNALERSDVCLLVMDAEKGMTNEEKKIANLIENAEKGCVLIFNKWDLVKGFRMEHCLQGIDEENPFIKHCPKIFVSALTKRNLDKIFVSVEKVLDAYNKRISTGTLNKSLTAAMQKYHPPVIGGKRLRIYYMAQIDTAPPRFVLFVNATHLMGEHYRRYLINHLRKEFGFQGTPLLLMLRGKEGKKGQPSSTTPLHYDRSLPKLDLIDEEASMLHDDVYDEPEEDGND